MLKLLKNTKMLVMIAMFVALQIVLTRFLSVETATQRVSFAFLPIAVSGIMFGPFAAGFAALVADLVGAVMVGFVPHPGIALNAFLTGAIFGLLLHKHGHSLPRVMIACVINVGVVAALMQPLWISQIVGAPYWPLAMSRFPVLAVMLPVQIFMIKLTWRYLGIYIERNEATVS